MAEMARSEWPRGAGRRRKGKLFRRKELWVPTWYGWVLLLALLFGLVRGLAAIADPFLSISRPVAATVLVVEGWLPDYAMEQAAREFREKGYQYLVVSGVPLPQGYIISGYDSFVKVAAATLLKLGVPAEKLIEAPGALVDRNRTFESAHAVRARLHELGIRVHGLNIISEGPHARRTRLVYRKAFGGESDVGVIAVRPMDYDAEHWWRTSEGAKTVFSEGIGWLMEGLFSSGR
jgi:hypothetical protein